MNDGAGSLGPVGSVGGPARNGRGGLVVVVAIPVVLAVVVAMAVAASLLFHRQVLKRIQHTDEGAANARAAEMISRIEHVTNPPLKLQQVGPLIPKDCSMTDGVSGVDGSQFFNLYLVPVTSRAAGTALMTKIEEYWAGQANTTVMGGLVVWSPDTPAGALNTGHLQQLDLTIDLGVLNPDNKAVKTLSLSIVVEGQCVPNP
jgi:hypothetical protein